jgi:hypothetical protein
MVTSAVLPVNQEHILLETFRYEKTKSLWDVKGIGDGSTEMAGSQLLLETRGRNDR